MDTQVVKSGYFGREKIKDNAITFRSSFFFSRAAAAAAAGKESQLWLNLKLGFFHKGPFISLQSDIDMVFLHHLFERLRFTYLFIYLLYF